MKKTILPALGLQRGLDALFYFDVKYFFSAMMESKNFAGGRRHGFDQEGRLTAQGDYQGHTAEVGEKFREQVSALNSSAGETRRISQLEEPPAGLKSFIEWANANDMIVFGTLSPSIDSEPVSPVALTKMQAWFSTSSKGGFLLLEGDSQYPNSCFFDTREHLNEECQTRHSRKIAAALKGKLSWDD